MINHYLKFIATLLLGCLLCAGCIKSPNTKTVPPVQNITARPPIGELHSITLLLPLKGDLAESSIAIKNGFLAAYYSNKSSTQSNTANIDVKIIDTSDKDLITTYQQAVADGADFIVGPLTKKDVTTIAGLQNLPVPTLALNTLDNFRSMQVVNLYQFGLSPQDESYQAALKIYQDGHPRVAVISQDNPWSNNQLKIFSNKYKQIGGTITASMFYTKQSEFDDEIKSFLGAENVTPDHNANSPPEEHHRTDIEAIFLLANPNQARQIVPLLKFYYAGNLPPIYSISTIYTGTPQPDLDQDIDGVKFCDIPWVIENYAALTPQMQDIHNKVLTLAPTAMQKDTRLYALGIDAYNIAASFNRFIKTPNAGFPGATGILVLDNYNHIYRKLGWTTMQQGEPNGF